MAVDALEDIITYPAPGFPNNPLWGLTIDSELVPNNYKIPGGAYEGDEDRWSMADSISNGLGGEIYFDVFGQAHCRPPPVITPDTDINQSVWTVAADQGDNSGVLISAARSISRSGVYNAVIVNGSAPKEGDPVPSAVVYDLDPRSKTYWNGPFGKKTLRISNSNLTTAGMCQISAKSTLRNVLGLSRSVSFTSLCNPALEAGDIIKVIYSDNTIELHLIDSVSIPLGSGSSKMTAQTRTINYV
jgi:hypothetical protein